MEADGWRIDAQLMGDETILINNWSQVTEQTGTRPQSHGFNFEKAYTRRL